MIDEMQARYRRINHEGAHAAAAHVLGDHPILEIAVDRPEEGTGGWVIFSPPSGPVDVRKWWTEYAVITRVGCMIDNESWGHRDFTTDRSNVRKVHPDSNLSAVSLAAFEAIVDLDAENLIARPEFDVCHRAICRELLTHFRDVMPGEVAHRIMADALHEADVLAITT